MIKMKPIGNDKSKREALSVTTSPTISVTKRSRGRPATGKAMASAQRQAKFKALRKALANG